MTTTQGLSVDQAFDLLSPRRVRRIDQAAAASIECPRCGSVNTKFCYFNNYSKTQPRYFCKACKRHWTKGGTLRNLATGGSGPTRKYKRQKTNKAAAAAAAIASAPATVPAPTNNNPLLPDDLPPLTELPYQTPLLDHLGSFSSYGSLLDICQQQQQQQQQFSLSSLSSFENSNPSNSNSHSLSLSTTSFDQSSSDTYNYAERMDDFINPHPWSSGCWNLDDIDTLISCHELNIPSWDEPPLV